jgi:serine/threonine protein kinase
MPKNSWIRALLGFGAIGLLLAGYASFVSAVLANLDSRDASSPQVRVLLEGILLLGGLAGLAVQIHLIRRAFQPEAPALDERERPREMESAASIHPPLALHTRITRPVPVPPTAHLRFGRYRIQRQIGAGGMGVVYLAIDPAFGREVAIKVLPAYLCGNDGSRERFRREARAVAALEHAAAVPVYDFGEEHGQPFLVMRYLAGGSLHDRLQADGMHPAHAIPLILRIIPALAKAHALGMVHRDIKPGNILFDREENPHLSDFGLVKLWEGEESLSQGEFFGTPTYASPEQCRGDQPIDHRSDIYSLTAMLFRMLTGFAPYTGNALALMAKHVHEPVPRLDEFAPGLPANLQPIIDRGMAKAPRDRYASVREIAEALNALIGQTTN